MQLVPLQASTGETKDTLVSIKAPSKEMF